MVEPTPTETMQIDTSADYVYLYEGLSRQNIDFHQAVAELVDNAISARAQSYFTVEILLRKDGDSVEVTVADDGKGISKADLKTRVLKLGGRGAESGVLNEHGFGLKNSLCLMTRNKKPFTILTADKDIADKSVQWLVEGPFCPAMHARLTQDERWSRDLVRCKGKTGTRVIASTTLDYVRTAYPRASRLDSLAPRLAEHLGVFYRHWLAGDPRNQIWIRWKDGANWQDLTVPAIKLPLSDESQSYPIDVEVDGVKAHAKYVFGQLDEAKTKGDHAPYPLDIYYKHNERTQGVDVVVHNKVILVHQLEELWPDQLRRRERNSFLGELILDGEAFSTINNKTGLDPHNPFWIRVKEELNKRTELYPPGYTTGREEAAICESLVDLLEKFTTGSHAQRNYPIWHGTGVKADIVHEGPGGSWLDVYEVKDDKAGPQDVYQLIMYRDGLVNDGKSPRLGRLVAESAPDSVLNLVKHWNGRTDIKNNSYKVEFNVTRRAGIHGFTRGGMKRRRYGVK